MSLKARLPARSVLNLANSPISVPTKQEGRSRRAPGHSRLLHSERQLLPSTTVRTTRRSSGRDVRLARAGIRQGNVNKDLEGVIMKTLAAFASCRAGPW